MLRYGFPFLGITIVALIIVDLVFRKLIIANSTGAGAYKVERILNTDYKGEIPIYGSSRAEGSFVPDSLAAGVFNYGLAGVQDNVWIYFLEQELSKKRTTPILINFDLDGLGYKNGDVAYWLFNSNNKDIRKFIDNWKMVYYIPVVKHMGFFEKYFVNFLQEKRNVTAFINKGAILEKKYLTPEEFDLLVKKREMDTVVFKNEPALHDQLQKLLSDTKGRKIYFIIPPYHPSYMKSIRNYNDAAAYLKELADMPNVEVLDYSKYPLEQQYFYNTTHLNYKGALLFTAMVKKDLRLQ
jgi:ssDNA-specific exonuclease RecJ